MAVAKIRLYVEHALHKEQCVPLNRDQAHYLFGVMRLNVGDAVLLFDGKNGEWRASVAQVSKRGGQLFVEDQTRAQQNPPDVWLLFAPIKKARTDFIVEKAAEMGMSRICPVQTDFTNAERIRQDRLQAHAVEAAEQCGGTYVPTVDALARFSTLMESWPSDRAIMFCDETLAGASTLPESEDDKWAVLIGPEGGFSKAERERLGGMAEAHSVSLGPRILRADTAAVAAMTLWQKAFGDWS